jgi:hypothetical protein
VFSDSPNSVVFHLQIDRQLIGSQSVGPFRIGLVKDAGK